MIKTVLHMQLLLLFSLVLPWSCHDSESERRPANRINVVLVTLDTVRADRLGCYGYEKAETPALDAFARKGVLFEQAFTPVPITLPSHTTMMTGLQPPEHGLRENDDMSLSAGTVTMAEVFKTQGYDTGAFIAAFVLDSIFGLERGFNAYDDDLGSSGRIADDRLKKERPADAVIDTALAWLDKRKSKPFFCWIHLFDAHAPYIPPAPYDERFDGRPYDGEIAFVDSQLGRLADWLKRNRLTDKTLVVIVGDHGEGLGDHGELRHAVFLYDSTMRVPLIFSLPGAFAEGRKVSEPVGLVDLFPTIIDAADQKEGVDLKLPETIKGRSLLAALKGERINGLDQYGESNYPFDYYGWSPLRSLTTTKWKYIRAPVPELYDRDSDPEELVNVAADNADLIEKLDKRLTALEKAMSLNKADRVKLSDEQRNRLAALGYTASGTGGALPANWKNLKDPKEMAHVLSRWITNIDLLATGRRKEAIADMETLVRENPGNPQFHSRLASSIMLTGDLEGAVEQYRLAIEAHKKSGLNDGPGHAKIYSEYGQALTGLKRYEEAISQFENALRIDPHDSGVLNNLGTVFFRTGRLLEAVICYGDAFQSAPDNEIVRTNLESTKKILGQYPKKYSDGLDLLRKGNAIRGNDPIILDIKARVLAACPDEELRDCSEAVVAAEQACRATGRMNPTCLDTLAITLAGSGRFEEAIAVSNEALSIAEKLRIKSLIDAIRMRIDLYEVREPYLLFPEDEF